MTANRILWHWRKVYTIFFSLLFRFFAALRCGSKSDTVYRWALVWLLVGWLWYFYFDISILQHCHCRFASRPNRDWCVWMATFDMRFLVGENTIRVKWMIYVGRRSSSSLSNGVHLISSIFWRVATSASPSEAERILRFLAVITWLRRRHWNDLCQRHHSQSSSINHWRSFRMRHEIKRMHIDWHDVEHDIKSRVTFGRFGMSKCTLS